MSIIENGSLAANEFLFFLESDSIVASRTPQKIKVSVRTETHQEGRIQMDAAFLLFMLLRRYPKTHIFP